MAKKMVKVAPKNTVEEREKKKMHWLFQDDEGIINKFERMVRAKYGFTREIIGKEILEALKNHMDYNGFEPGSSPKEDSFSNNPFAHKQFLISNHELFQGCLDDKYSAGEKITFSELQEILRGEFDLKDKRTHKSYVDALEAKKVLNIPEGIGKYDFYYFKEIPPLSELERRTIELKNKLTEPQFKVLMAFPQDNSEINYSKISRITGMNPDDVKLAVKELVKLRYVYEGIESFSHFKLSPAMELVTGE